MGRRRPRRAVRENPIELAPLLWAGGLLAGAAAVGGAIYAVQQAKSAAAPAPAANPFPTQLAPVSPVTTSTTSAAAAAAAAQQAAAQAAQLVNQAAGGAQAPAPAPAQTFPAGYNPYAGTNPAPSAPAPLPTVTAPVTSGAQATQVAAPGAAVPAPTSPTFPAGYNPYAGTTNPAPAGPVTLQPFNNTPAPAPTNTPAPAPAPTNTGVVPVAAGGTCPPGYTKNGFDCIAPNANGGCPPGTVPWQGKCQPASGTTCPPGTVPWQGGCEAP
jgi:hypothetical protein